MLIAILLTSTNFANTSTNSSKLMQAPAQLPLTSENEPIKELQYSINNNLYGYKPIFLTPLIANPLTFWLVRNT
jgi:hypothetical protein